REKDSPETDSPETNSMVDGDDGVARSRAGRRVSGRFRAVRPQRGLARGGMAPRHRPFFALVALAPRVRPLRLRGPRRDLRASGPPALRGRDDGDNAGGVALPASVSWRCGDLSRTVGRRQRALDAGGLRPRRPPPWARRDVIVTVPRESDDRIEKRRAVRRRRDRAPSRASDRRRGRIHNGGVARFTLREHEILFDDGGMNLLSSDALRELR